MAALIPDFLICAAVFVEKQPLTVEVLESGMVFATYGGRDYYIGTVTSTAVFSANAPWMNVNLLRSNGLPCFKPEALLRLYDCGRHARAHQALAGNRRMSLDAVSELRGFAECEE